MEILRAPTRACTPTPTPPPALCISSPEVIGRNPSIQEKGQNRVENKPYTNTVKTNLPRFQWSGRPPTQLPACLARLSTALPRCPPLQTLPCCTQHHIHGTVEGTHILYHSLVPPHMLPQRDLRLRHISNVPVGGTGEGACSVPHASMSLPPGGIQGHSTHILPRFSSLSNMVSLHLGHGTQDSLHSIAFPASFSPVSLSDSPHLYMPSHPYSGSFPSCYPP